MSRRERLALVAIVLVCLGCILPPALAGVSLPIPLILKAPFLLLGILLLPGYLADELLHISGERVTLASPALWLALSCGVLAPAGWLVLGLHTPLRPFGLLVAGEILILLLLVFWRRGRLRPLVWEYRRRDVWLLLIAGMLLLAVLIGALQAPRSADDWSYGKYLREYVDSPALNRWDTAYGPGVPVTPRMRYNVWLVTQAYLAAALGLDPAFEFLGLFDPLLAFMALLATYTLARQVLGSSRRALAAVCLQVVVYLTAPGAHDPGYAFLALMNADKWTATLILLPAALALLLRVAAGDDRPAWWGLIILAPALVATHGEIYAFLVLACGLFFLALLALRQPHQRLLRVAGVTLTILPWTALIVVTALGYSRLGPRPGGPGWELLSATNEGQGRIIYLYLAGRRLFIVAPDFVLNPSFIVGLLATPLLFLRRLRGQPATALLLGCQLGSLLLMFVPGLPNLMALFVDYNTLWRLSWLMQPALTLAYVIGGWWPALAGRLDDLRAWFQARARAVQISLLTAGSVALLLVWLALALLPLRSFNLEIAGRVSRAWMPTPGLHAALRYAAPAVHAMGSPLVLASEADTFQIPSSWGEARVLAMRGPRGTLTHFPPERQSEAMDRLQLTEALPAARPEDPDFIGRLATLGVDLIVISRDEAPQTAYLLDRFPLAYPKLLQTTTHSIYLVNLRGDSEPALVGRAQLALAQGDRAGACEQFGALNQRWPASPLVAAGQGYCLELAGQAAAARQAYAGALASLTAGWQPAWPPALEPWLRWRSDLAAELADPLRQGTREFVQERLYRLERNLSDAGAPEVVFVAGWPRWATHTAANASACLELGGQAGETLYAYVYVPDSGGQEVALNLLVETREGIHTAVSDWLEPAQETQLRIGIPADGSGRLCVQALSSYERAVATWYGWRPAAPEDAGSRLGDSEIVNSAVDQLSALLELTLGHPIDERLALRYAGALTGLRPDAASVALQRGNLLTNPDFRDGVRGWRRNDGDSTSGMRVEAAPDSSSGWVAFIGGEEDSPAGWCQTLRVQAGRDYLYFVQAAGDVKPGRRTSLSYWDYQRLGRLTSDVGFTRRGSFAREAFIRLVHVPAGVKEISVCPALLRSPGTMRLERVWFGPVEALRGD
jgi:hypothetical protein